MIFPRIYLSLDNEHYWCQRSKLFSSFLGRIVLVIQVCFLDLFVSCVHSSIVLNHLCFLHRPMTHSLSHWLTDLLTHNNCVKRVLFMVRYLILTAEGSRFKSPVRGNSVGGLLAPHLWLKCPWTRQLTPHYSRDCTNKLHLNHCKSLCLKAFANCKIMGLFLMTSDTF